MTSESENLRRGGSRIASVVGWMADGVMIFGVGVMLALQVSVIQSWLKSAGLSAANGSLRGRVSAERLGGPLPFGIRLEGVELHDRDGDLMASVDSFRADVSLVSLLSGGLRIDSVTVDGLRAVAHRTPDGSVNFTGLVEPAAEEPETPVEPPSESAGFWLDFEEIDVRNVRAVWVDETVTPLPARGSNSARMTIPGLRAWVAGGEASTASIGLSEIRNWREGAVSTPAVAAIDGFHVDAALTIGSDGTIGATVRSLESRLAVDRLPKIDHLKMNQLGVRYSTGPGQPEEVSASIDGIDVSPDLQVRGLGARIPLGSEAVGTEASYSGSVERLRVSPDIIEATGLLKTPPTTETVVMSLGAYGQLRDFRGFIDATAGEAELVAALEGGVQDSGLTAETALWWDNLTSSLTPALDDGIETNGSLHAAVDTPLSVDGVEELKKATAEVSLVGGRQRMGAMSVDTVIAETQWNGQRLDVSRLEVRGALGQLSGRANIRPWEGHSRLAVRGRVGSDRPGHPLTDYLGGRFNPGAGQFGLDAEWTRRAGTLAVENLLSSLDRVDLSADWDISAFRFPGIQIRNTDGDVKASIARDSNADGPTAPLDVTGSTFASVESFSVGDTELSSTSIDGTFQLRDIDTDQPVSLAFLNPGSADIDVSASTEKTRYGAFDVTNGSIDTTAFYRSDDATWLVSVQSLIAAFNSETADVTDLQADLEAELEMGGATDDGSVNWSAVTLRRGEVDSSVTTVGAGGIRLSDAELSSRLRGTIDSLDGTAGATVATLTTSAGSYTSLETNLRVRDTRRIDLDVSVTPESSSAGAESSPRPVSLSLFATVREDWGAATLDSLALSRGDITWQTSESADLVWAGEAYRVDSLALQRDDQRIALDATYASSGSIDASLEIDRLELSQFESLTGLESLASLQGRLTLVLRARGTVDSPSIALDVDAEGLKYGTYGPVKTRVRFTGDDRRLDLDTFRIGYDGTTMLTAMLSLPVDVSIAEGRYQFDRSRKFDVDIEMPDLRLSRATALAGVADQVPVTGIVAASVSASGRIPLPTVDVSLSGRDITYQPPEDPEGDESEAFERIGFQLGLAYDSGRKAPLEFDAQASWHDQTLVKASIQSQLPLHTWVYDPPPLGEAASALARREMQANVDVGPIEVDGLPVDVLKEADASGTVAASLSITGRPLAPSASLKVNVDDFGWTRFRDIYVDVEAQLEDERLTVSNMLLEWDADPIFRANARLPVPVRSLILGETVDDVPLEARVQLVSLPLTKLSPFDYTFAYLRGQFAAFLRVDGTLRDPSFAFRAALTDTRLSDQDVATVAVQVTGQKDRVRLATVVCRNDRTVLAGHASAPMNLDPIDVAVSGEPLLAEGPIEGEFYGEKVPLANIVPPALTRGIAEELGGTFSIDMQLAGTWDEPRPTGTLVVENGSVTLPGYGRRFRDIQLRASVDRDAIEVSRMQIADENGSLKGEATIPLETFVPRGATATINADDFDLTGFAAGYTAFVSGNIDVEGDFTETTYALDVDISKLEVDLPESQPRGSYPTSLETDIVVADRRGEQARVIDIQSLTTGGGTGSSYTVTVDVDLDRQSWVRHPNGDVNFTGAMEVTMTPTLLTLSGGLETLRGQFEFLGRDFDIPRKADVIRFTGAYPPNPRLNIEALYPLDQNIAEEIGQASGGDPQIKIRVTGTASEPRLAMESDPGMSESEIIFVLMTGRAPSDAGVGEDQGVASQAVAAASGLFAGLLQQELRGSFPVDMVRLETGSGGLETSRLRVGKYITTNLFVSSAYQFAGQDEEAGFTTRVEYHFLPDWMLEAKYGDDNTGEFNVFWDLY